MMQVLYYARKNIILSIFQPFTSFLHNTIHKRPILYLLFHKWICRMSHVPKQCFPHTLRHIMLAQLSSRTQSTYIVVMRNYMQNARWLPQSNSKPSIQKIVYKLPYACTSPPPPSSLLQLEYILYK